MHFEQSMHIAAPRETVWKFMADTDRLNRELGLPPVLFTFKPRESGGTDAFATMRIAGIALRYREHPFEWVRPSYYRVRRTFPGGPIREIVSGARLEDADGGTRITGFVDLEPSNAVGAVACRAIGTKSASDFLSVCKRLDAYLSKAAVTPYPRHAGKPPAQRERLEQKLRLLAAAGADDRLTERLGDHIAHAPPEDTIAMRPFALAGAWGAERMAVLKMCLLAAGHGVGLLDLRWRVLCPACRGGPPSASRLADIGEEVHCASCNIRFDAEFDRSVEVCFGVAPAVRAVRETTYCVGGPGRAPHAVAQFYLMPGERRTEGLFLPDGPYTLSSLQAHLPASFTGGAPGSEEVTVEIRRNGDRADLIVTPPVNRIDCQAKWNFANDTAEAVILRVETPEWTSEAATAALVTSLQTFREQFSSEVLAPGMELAVRQICVLFSDLKGSTAMYRAQGDAHSYKTVRVHFDRMRRIIDTHNGAIVKTIGDAVMATFFDPADGLEAALAIQRETAGDAGQPVVKLGLHYGPAIAVNANETLDYFGQTVNLAARIQSVSEGKDVVISAALAEDPRVQQMLRAPKLTVIPFESTVRGIDEPVRMFRIVTGSAPC